MAWAVATAALGIAGVLAVRLRASRAALGEVTRQRDLLDRSRSEVQSQARLQERALIQSMIEGVVVLDVRGRVTLFNSALVQMFKIEGDPMGKSLIEALRHHALQEILARVESEKQVRDFGVELSEIPRRYLQVNAASLLGPQGEQRGTLVVFHDLSRLKGLESTMKEFVANVSHELRTPLSLIKGYVETLIDGAKDDPAVSEKFLRTIEKHTNRLTFLIEDLLTISRLESGQLQLDLQEIELLPVIEAVVHDLDSKASARHVRVEIIVPGALKVMADPERLEQVLANLVDNAIKYGRENGHIRIESHSRGDGFVELGVADDGPGIPPEALGRVFERFYRIDRARTREQGGTGLGLSIAKHIVQSHGGEIRVESEYGCGARFSFTLKSC